MPAPKEPCPSQTRAADPSNFLSTLQLQTEQPLEALPSNSNVTLIHSTLGIGHQNYTCNGTAFVQTEPGDGAVAFLYDTTAFLQRRPNAVNTLAERCNYESCRFPQLLNRLLGEHYFTADLIPTFALSEADPPLILSAAKAGDVPAPDSTNIDWLLLTANPAAVSEGLSEVYRVDTFGGKPPATCSSVGEMTSIPYTAQYWFYA